MGNRKPTIDVENLREVLPHGCGIDGAWTFKLNADGGVRCANAWHAMNDAGYYCGWIPFAFTVRANLVPVSRNTIDPKDSSVLQWRLKAGPVRAGFKRASRAGLHLADLADDIGQTVDHALSQSGTDALVFDDAEGGA